MGSYEPVCSDFFVQISHTRIAVFRDFFFLFFKMTLLQHNTTNAQHNNGTKMFSFRFLNPRLVDTYPEDVCFKGIGDEPDVLCDDLPPNQRRFLGWWYLSPERHFWEWIGFTAAGMVILYYLGPKVSSKSFPSPNTARHALMPRFWMKASTLLFYPYVAYIKLSWPGSYYPGRWLLFVGMPVGTIWILSLAFCFATSSRRSYWIRFWLLEAWFSFLPMLVNLVPALFHGAIFSIREYAHGRAPKSGHDGDNATISYFLHSLYLAVVPLYYIWICELSSQPRSFNIRELWSLVIDCTLRQLVGTAIVVLYYMSIITPTGIVFGVNVNFLLYGYDQSSNFRICYVIRLFYYSCAIRYCLQAAKLANYTIRRRLRPRIDAVKGRDLGKQQV